MKIIVIGAGAMGCLYGLAMAGKGHEVRLVDTWAEHAEAMQRDGAMITGVGGEQRAMLPVSADASQWPGWADVAFLQTDTNNSVAGARVAKDALSPEGYAITFQNGIGNVEALVAELGEARVLGGISYHSAAMAGPGYALHTNAGVTYVGELDGSESQRAQMLSTALGETGFETEAVDNILDIIWTKWVHNCAINPICAASGLRVGEMARNPAAAAMQAHILDEIMAVVRAKGLRLTDDDPVGHIKAYCRLKYNRPSMQQHMEAGKQTEIDSLNGALIREAQGLGIPVPWNEALVAMVKAREAAMMQVTSGAEHDYAALEVAAKREAATGEAG